MVIYRPRMDGDNEVEEMREAVEFENIAAMKSYIISKHTEPGREGTPFDEKEIVLIHYIDMDAFLGWRNVYMVSTIRYYGRKYVGAKGPHQLGWCSDDYMSPDEWRQRQAMQRKKDEKTFAEMKEALKEFIK